VKDLQKDWDKKLAAMKKKKSAAEAKAIAAAFVRGQERLDIARRPVSE
jgi:hypothetical protein